jgi:type II secretory pathway pseudopilin PulG
MGLAGQPFDGAHGRPFDSAHGSDNRGYAMAALLVGMSVMAVLMGALLPVWTQMATREKEEELIFRGKQYARAVGLFERKYANTPPPTVDVLVEQRFLRKKYKDPITNDDFQPIYANQQAQQGVSAPQGAQRPGQQATATTSTPAPQPVGVTSTGTGQQGGIIGVTSKSKNTSIKLYNGRDKYNEWSFVYIQTTQRPTQPGTTGGQQPGQRPGSPGAQGTQGPGQRGGFQQPPSGFGQPPSGFGQPNRPPVSPGATQPGATPPNGPRRPPGQ